MQPDLQQEAPTIARFLHISRLHLGLLQAPAGLRPTKRVAKPGRHILRSLIVAGSLGALFGGPAFAGEASRTADPAKRNSNPQSTRAKADERLNQSTTPDLPGKPR